MFAVKHQLPVSVMVLIVRCFFVKEPLPGGCNQEFELEVDPNINLNVQPAKTTGTFLVI